MVGANKDFSFVNMQDIQASQQEWQTLQNQFDSYEKWSLLIKLVHISIVSLALIFSQLSLTIAVISMTIWFQDSIWKTFQSRIESRLFSIESSIRSGAPVIPCQFNSEFANNRGSTVSLIKEYLRTAVKPTVAFPHLVLLLLLFYCQFA